MFSHFLLLPYNRKIDYDFFYCIIVNFYFLEFTHLFRYSPEDIERIYRSGLNVREAYYLAIKLGFPKSKLIEVLNVYNEKDISKGALKMTNANERARVKEAERKNISRYREIKDTNVIGG